MSERFPPQSCLCPFQQGEPTWTPWPAKGKYAAKYDPLEKVPISDSMLDWALGRADLDRCWNDGVYCFFLVGEGGRVTKGVMGFRGRPTTGNTERLAIDLEF